MTNISGLHRRAQSVSIEFVVVFGVILALIFGAVTFLTSKADTCQNALSGGNAAGCATAFGGGPAVTSDPGDGGGGGGGGGPVAPPIDVTISRLPVGFSIANYTIEEQLSGNNQGCGDPQCPSTFLTADMDASGGVSPYSWQLSGPGGLSSMDSSPVSLEIPVSCSWISAHGGLSFLAYDSATPNAGGATSTVLNCSSAPVSLDASYSAASLSGDGSLLTFHVDVTATGGVGPYTYRLYPPDGAAMMENSTGSFDVVADCATMSGSGDWSSLTIFAWDSTGTAWWNSSLATSSSPFPSCATI